MPTARARRAPIDVPDERRAGAPTQDSNSLLIDQPVRSGQSIVFEKGDVTIVGSVASGAEVIAGGSIHVYGTLRGRAIAGLTGNNRARIFCRKLEAELLAIDGVYQTADDMSADAARQAGAGLARRRGDDVGNARLKRGEKQMATVLVVTSGKGGVGKTTSTAALGAALAQQGQNVVVVDFDVGLRNLDLVMGAERRVVFDLINVVQGDAKLPQALIRDKRIDTLSLLPASQTRDKDALTAEGVTRVIAELREKFDWIICDSPAGIERGATLAMRHADAAVVVTNPEVSSVRDSDRIIGMLDSKTAKAEKGRAHRQAPAADPLRSGTRRAWRDAEDRGCAGDPVDPAARHHPGERGSAARVEPRHAGDARQSRTARRRRPISRRRDGCGARRWWSPCRPNAAASWDGCSAGGPWHESDEPVPPAQLRAGRARAAAGAAGA